MSIPCDELLPREKLQAKGPENLKDHELLAILLRTGSSHQGVLETAKSILKSYPLTQLTESKLGSLQKIKGIGSAKASSLIAAFELSKRAFKKGLGTRPTLQNAKDVLPLVSSIRNSKKEHFVAIYLNSRKQVIHQETISIGSLDGSLVHPREVFQPAIQHSAAATLLVHNHPSGETTPSRADISVSQRLCQAGKLLGIEVLDHIIISKDNYTSMKEMDCQNQIGFSIYYDDA